MICSSEKRFFTSNLRQLRDWTPNRRATQNRGDVEASLTAIQSAPSMAISKCFASASDPKWTLALARYSNRVSARAIMQRK